MTNFSLSPLPTDSVEGGPRAQIVTFHRLTPSIWKYRSNVSKKNYFICIFQKPYWTFQINSSNILGELTFYIVSEHTFYILKIIQ